MDRVSKPPPSPPPILSNFERDAPSHFSRVGPGGSCTSRAEAPATVIRCVGNCGARVPRPAAALPGLAMCGGHMYPGVTEKSDDDVYRWLIDRAKGGDVVVLTADPVDTPCDLYNGYIYNLSNVAPRPNSVTTICFTNRSDSLNPKVAELLKSATAVRIILFCHVLLRARERSLPMFLGSGSR